MSPSNRVSIDHFDAKVDEFDAINDEIIVSLTFMTDNCLDDNR